MTRALIVDDEAPARRIVRQYLAYTPAVEVVGECANGPEALEAIRAERPDLVFLDVQMPGLSGFDVLDRLRAENVTLPRIIFSTAFDQYAVRAFEVHAVDYLLKPYDRARFVAAVERAVETPVAGLDALVRLLQTRTEAPTYDERFLVQQGPRVTALPAADVLWIEAAGDYAKLHTAERTFLASQRLGQFEARLDPARFLRIHRSAIVALDALTHLHPDGSGGYHVTLRNGATLRASRTYASALRDRMV